MNTEKERVAIERLRTFVPQNGEPYYLCYSGGKDSDVIRILAQLADVPHEIHHNLTTVDTPETMQYIKSIPGVIIDKARYADGTPKTMWNLIPRKLMPPTRMIRYCCEHLKEWGGKGRLRITGVRWDESVKRKQNRGVVNIVGKPKTTENALIDAGLPYQINPSGGIILSMDNETVRSAGDFVQTCYKSTTTTLNPIVDWTEEDVWAFLHYYGCESNPLYQCGYSRIGCIGCPIANQKNQRKELELYPKYRANYVRAFERMLIERERKGKSNKGWKTGEDVMRWWLGESST